MFVTTDELQINYVDIGQYSKQCLDCGKDGIEDCFSGIADETIRRDLLDHKEDICKFVAIGRMADNGLRYVSEEMAKSIMCDLDYECWDNFSECADYVEDFVFKSIEDSFDDYLNDTALASWAMENVYADHNYSCVNPCAMSASAYAIVLEKGFDVAFAEQIDELTLKNMVD